MKKSDKRLLLNAEPFGFGPTAAIASFFPYLRKKFKTIGYVGKNHTLDLQKCLQYDHIHDLTGMSMNKEKETIKEIMARYDVVLTALDFPVAKEALNQGLKVIIYDPLCWYWRKIPTTIQKSDLYIAQDFYGVKNRLIKDARCFPQKYVVPPIIKERKKSKRSHILINFGGLQNPLIREEDLVDYARVMLKTILSVIPQNEKIVIATSNRIAKKLNDPRVKSYAYEKMDILFSKTKFAFMTPGLGNIYDAANHAIPTIWLPPANDSQGQQLELLVKNKAVDGWVNWDDFLHKIDYRGVQKTVLKNIAHAMRNTARDKKIQSDLKVALQEKVKGMRKTKRKSSQKLLDRFGKGGSEKVAERIYQYAQSLV